MKPIILFFTRGPGLILSCCLIAICVGWMIKDWKKSTGNEVTKKAELETVKKDQPKPEGKAPEVRELSKNSLTPVFAQPIPNPTVVQQIKEQTRQVPQLVMFYTSVSEPSPTPAPAPKKKTPKSWLPPFTLIPCSLVNTVESSNVATPIIAEVQMDVFQGEKMIIPAGSLLCSLSASSVRDRIRADGEWVLVFQDGYQLHFKGMALDRVKDPNREQFGIEDGTGGLEGEIEQGDHWANLKSFTSMILTALITTGQTGVAALLQQEHTGFGFQMPEVQGVLAHQMDEMWNGRMGDSQFVRVPSGAELYVCPVEPIFPDNATIEGTLQTVKEPSESEQLEQMARKALQQREMRETTNENQKSSY